LIIRDKSSFVPSYVFAIDRSRVPKRVTATAMATDLMRLYPDLVRHAEPRRRTADWSSR
jgi:hypothetical protein